MGPHAEIATSAAAGCSSMRSVALTSSGSCTCAVRQELRGDSAGSSVHRRLRHSRRTDSIRPPNRRRQRRRAARTASIYSPAPRRDGVGLHAIYDLQHRLPPPLQLRAPASFFVVAPAADVRWPLQRGAPIASIGCGRSSSALYGALGSVLADTLHARDAVGSMHDGRMHIWARAHCRSERIRKDTAKGATERRRAAAAADRCNWGPALERPTYVCSRSCNKKRCRSSQLQRRQQPMLKVITYTPCMQPDPIAAECGAVYGAPPLPTSVGGRIESARRL